MAPPQPHISVRFFGRALLGFLSLLSAVAFGAYAALLVFFVQPVGWWKVLLHVLLCDGFFVAAIFLLLATMSFWSIGGRRVDVWLHKLALQATIAIIAFGVGICLFASVQMFLR